ncbi:hypothetical protein HBH47_177210 [Parastagonospora nodorum]|nr:hypothetical protein HBH47_177210 [Parastagonospora nodorum]KAH4258808.1 hypothetical protein HBI03_138630 [Parastagonospora nodorum]KAH4444915.1 hypothetical protein HBH91_150160 [Parastagonospora nodorum]KAH4546179.1 hypothetical protein HBH85_078480 [Parastagonospora nodorum]KAH4865985.1 hypothetical protein HBH59_157450 [Parastagonospora nodorum]
MATTKAQAVADMRAFADADNPLEEITQANQIKSPLLELPAEIRGIIYEYFFCDLIVRVNTNEPRLKRYSTYLQPLAPRQLCRQIRCETQSAYFKYTQFYFQNYDLCDSSDKVALPLGDINCSAIQSINLAAKRLMKGFKAVGRAFSRSIS